MLNVESHSGPRYLFSAIMSWQSYSKDWITVAVLLVAFFGYFERTQPFYRQFRLDDPTLQHPFAHEERVTDLQLYFLCTVVPMTIIGCVFAVKKRYNEQLASAQATLVGLWVSLTVAACITDMFKDMIGGARPDFLERCGARPGTPAHKFVDVSVCQSPLGVNRLADGMKLTPSGHSSMAFATMFYLFLWLGDHGRIPKVNRWVWLLVCSLPLVLSTYIAFSRTQDYRHHFVDVFFGLSIGIVVGWLLYKKYHD